VDPTADPGALDAAARAVRREADQLDGGGSRAGDFLRQAEGSRWTGFAANQFQMAVRADRDRARAAAGDLRAIATMIEAGAEKIRRYRLEQARLERERQQQQKTPLVGHPR
jgi:hypothetical protein